MMDPVDKWSLWLEWMTRTLDDNCIKAIVIAGNVLQGFILTIYMLRNCDFINIMASRPMISVLYPFDDHTFLWSLRVMHGLMSSFRAVSSSMAFDTKALAISSCLGLYPEFLHIFQVVSIFIFCISSSSNLEIVAEFCIVHGRRLIYKICPQVVIIPFAALILNEIATTKCKPHVWLRYRSVSSLSQTFCVVVKEGQSIIIDVRFHRIVIMRSNVRNSTKWIVM